MWVKAAGLLCALGFAPSVVVRAQAALPSAALPAEVDRVLRDYERLWAAKDGAGLAGLFATDGFVLSSNRPAIRGRAAIEAQYTGTSGGPLKLRALAYAAEDTVGYIIGAYRYDPTTEDQGKFILALKRAPRGAWLIAADIDNGNGRR